MYKSTYVEKLVLDILLNIKGTPYVVKIKSCQNNERIYFKVTLYFFEIAFFILVTVQGPSILCTGLFFGLSIVVMLLNKCSVIKVL